MKITVIGGAGYVGLVSAACLAYKGHDVYAVDCDREKVALLRQGIPVIHEEGLELIIRAGLNSGKLCFTSDLSVAVESHREAIILAVGTPEDEKGRCDLTDLFDTVTQLSYLLKGGEVVVNKSTVPVGTTDTIQSYFDQLVKTGPIYTAMCPEFLREGASVKDFLEPSRIVIGTSHPEAADALLEIFSDFSAPKIVTSTRNAELAKYAANTYLATRISFINEIAETCELVGGDIQKVVEIIGLDPRIGSNYLKPGLGFGGPCLDKDLKALIHTAGGMGGSVGLLEAVLCRNERQQHLVLQKLKAALGNLRNNKIGILGLTFKPGTNDLRNSPALKLAQRLYWMNAEVSAFDPAIKSLAGTKLEGLVKLAQNISDLARGKDAMVIATDWPEFRELELASIAAVMHQPILVDARRVLDPEKAIFAGLNYLGIGFKSDSSLDRRPLAQAAVE